MNAPTDTAKLKAAIPTATFKIVSVNCGFLSTHFAILSITGVTWLINSLSLGINVVPILAADIITPSFNVEIIPFTDFD